MTRFFKELYFTLFTIGFRFRAPQRFGGGWGFIVDAGKGVACVCLTMFCIFAGIESCIEIRIGKRLSFESTWWWAVAATLALYLPNYYILVTRGHGVKFEREFTNLKKSRKVLLLVCCAVLLLFSMVFANYARSAYQRFFNS